MGMYLQNALSVSQLYGSLGLIPLFMFWVYLMWLAVLFGLEVSSVLQHLHGRPLGDVKERPPEPALVDPAAVTLIMKRIAEGFEAGQPTSVEQISESTDLPPLLVERIIVQLVSAGLIHRLADSDNEVILSRPPEAIPVARLLDVGFGLANRELRAKAAAGLFSRLRAAQQQVAANAHLGSLLDRTTP